MGKKRILFVGEGSFLSTGFSTYYRELLPRLVATGKYEIAELGCYAKQNDPRVNDFIQGRWKFYGTMPLTQEDAAVYQQPSPHPRDNNQNINQFGAWKFDEIVAEFKPDIVVDIRDNWMMTWQLRSPFRKWFKLVWMPTVDAEPQKEEWIDDYEKADMILSYSDYGIHVLKRQSLKMRVFPEALRPGVDLDMFQPMERKAVREFFRLKEDVPVIGSVMRNQSILFDSHIQTANGRLTADNLETGAEVLTAQGNLKPIMNIWSYKKKKPYTRLKIFGNNLEGPNATSEHKFHFEYGVKPIGNAVQGDRVKMPTLPLEKMQKSTTKFLLDIAQYINVPDHWKLTDKKIVYAWRGTKRELNRFLEIDADIMRLFGWYCAEGWISQDKLVQFGLDSNETGPLNEILDIVESKFGVRPSYCDDKEFDSRTITWSNKIFALLFKALFGNGSRRKQIPLVIKTAPYSVHLAAAYLEGDGSFYNLDKKNDYILASSFSENLARDVRDILQSNGVFTTVSQSLDSGTTKTNLGIYREWAEKISQYTKHYGTGTYIKHARGVNWKNHVTWDEQDRCFYVPVLEAVTTEEEGPYFDFEVEDDHTYNCEGYACDNSRKLFPDLIDAFSHMKNLFKGEAAVDKSVLLLHSAWPDNAYSYDYPRHVMRLQSYDWMPYASKGIKGVRGIKDSVMQSLMCHKCHSPSLGFALSLYGQPLQNGKVWLPCMVCGENTATCPATGDGYQREDLAKLYNLMDLYVQCSICFTGDTPVLGRDGWKPIKDIMEGEYVYGRDGLPHRVYKTMSRQADNIVQVLTHNNPFPTVCTANHPFLVVKDAWPSDKRSLREKIAQKNPDELEFEYRDAGDLEENDMCVQTIPQHEIQPCLKLEDDTFVDIDEDMAWFLGLMVGDGNVNTANKVPYCRVTCHGDDEVCFSRVDAMARRLDHEAKRRDYKDRNAFDVSVYDVRLARALRPWLYADDKQKKCPPHFTVWPMRLQYAFIRGLIHADGTKINANTDGLFTTSEAVARDVFFALQRLGLYFNAHNQNRKGRRPGFKFEINHSGKRSSTNSLYWEQHGTQYYLSKVHAIGVDDSGYTPTVYNIDVEDDHNYIICGHTVHNCEGDGMPIQEAKACGVPTLVMDYTAMREKGRRPDYKHLEDTKDYSCHQGGEIIEVDRYYHEPETSCKRALPDVHDLAQKMRDMITDKERLKQMSSDARECVETNYDWNDLFKNWEFVLDNIKPKDREGTWDSPINVMSQADRPEVPDNLNDEQFIEWLYLNVLKYPQIDPEGARMWIQYLKQGAERSTLYDQFVHIANQQVDDGNARERLRAEAAEARGERVERPAEETEWM